MDTLLTTAMLSMGFLAVSFALVLGVAHSRLKVEEDPRVEELNGILPGVNCGACGYLSCHDFAEHIASGEADPARCRVLGEEAMALLHEVMGTDAFAKVAKLLPVTRCAATSSQKKTDGEYHGIKSCRASHQMFGGGLRCEYGCVGFGDCVNACPFGALEMVDGLPVVSEEKCTSCGKCVPACPRGLIELLPKRRSRTFYVACNSHDDALRVRQVCGVGCIACGICAKLTGEEQFFLDDLLARENVDTHNNAKDLEKVQAKCPTKVIKKL